MTNGTISQIADSGPIVLSTPTSGALNVAGELDEWTFFGRAGQNYTIAVETGSGNVLAPQLSYAELRLIDPSSNLVARASNNVARQTVALMDIALPVDGNYRIQVRAPANQPAATGNYVITIWEVTPDIAPLSLNQTMNGRIETPYSVDRWTFSAVSGQQIRFDFINASAPGIIFTLRGPNGWVGFSNLVNDSSLINLSESGNYTLTAQGTGGAYEMAYAFAVIETTQTDLDLGIAFTGQFIGNEQAQLFRITLSNSTPMRITLFNSGAGNRTELYLGRGNTPTRGIFDYSSASGPGANRDLLIPNASASTWYALVYGDQIATPGSFTIQASVAGVFLTGVTPKRHANSTNFVMTVTGAGFEAGTRVELLAGGGIPLAATNVSVDSFTQLTAWFDPAFAPPGLYSVRVQQPDSDSALLTNVFQLLEPGLAKLETRVIPPGSLGYHGVATIYIEYKNSGTAAMPAPLLDFTPTQKGRAGAFLTLESGRVFQGYWTAADPEGFSHSIQILASSPSSPGVLQPGDSVTVPIYYSGWQQPWDFSYPPVSWNLSVRLLMIPMSWIGLPSKMECGQLSISPGCLGSDLAGLCYASREHLG